MAKYCSKCGKTLPDGVEVCPDCHGAGDEAALFTRIGADTEIWKDDSEPKKKKPRKKIKPRTRDRLVFGGAAVLLVAAIVFVILYMQPLARVRRAVRAGEYDRALTIYTEKIAGRDKTAAEDKLGAFLVKTAGELCDKFEAGEIEPSEAETAFDGLYAFGLYTGELDAQYARFEELLGTRSQLSAAEKLIRSGQFLEACDLLLAVPEGDGEYEAAQARAQECLDYYAEKVLYDIAEPFEAKEYENVIDALREGQENLKGYGRFSAGIDAKLEECYKLYADLAIEEAKNLADLGEYDSAVRMIQNCIDCIGYDTPELNTELAKYTALAEGKTTDEAVALANAFYKDGEYADAFRELESAMARLGDSVGLERELSLMEERYYADTLFAVKQVLDGDRENIDAALDAVDDAAAIRKLDAFEQLKETLEGLRPLDLAQCAFTGREGDIFRNPEAFDGDHGGGWIWGGDGSYILYDLEGEYDQFEGVLSVRSEKTGVSGSFEVYCDGKLTFTSETVSGGGEDVEVSFRIAGCKELKIVFHCSYETSSLDNGNCLHGICVPAVMRDMI